MIYLDYNATTPVSHEVFEAMTPFLTGKWGNPSSSYRFGSELKGVVELARSNVAELIGARPSEVIFTGNATEANNTAIHAALRTNPARRHIVTSQVEHSSVLNHCRALEKEGFCVTYLTVNRDGLLKLADLENAITDETAVVSFMWANNETGVLFPVKEIAELCHSRGVLFHCDAVQAVGKVPVDVSVLPVDYLSLTGHKLGAAKGVGALYVRRTAPFWPLLHGGHQERGRRGGTENVALIVGLGVAAAFALNKLPDYERTVRALRDKLEEGILGKAGEARHSERAGEWPSADSKRPIDAERNGHPTQRLANTTNLTFHGIDSEALLILLDQEGICASSGSACLADSDEPSHVVKAMKPDTGAARQMIRFSLGMENSMQEVETAIAAVWRAVEALRG